MTLTRAVILYDFAVLAALGLDFVLVRRRSASVIAWGPALLMAAAVGGLAWQLPTGAVEFVAIAITILATALFGYANFLAFVTRGITFAIIHNHARPPRERHPDREFIALEERIAEMRGYGWIESTDAGWRLNDRGRRVVRLRQALLRALRIEAVG